MTYDADTINEIIARIEDSVDQDTRIDAMIEQMFLCPDIAVEEILFPINFTGSLEKVIHLIQVELPEYGDWLITRGRCCDCEEPLYGASLSPPGNPDFDGLISEHEVSPAHALLLSFLNGVLLRQEAKAVVHEAHETMQ